VDFSSIFLFISILIFISSKSFGLEFLDNFTNYPVTRSSIFYFIRLGIVPWSVLFIVGVFKILKNRNYNHIFLIITFFTFLAIFSLMKWKEERFLAPVFIVYVIISSLGFIHFKNKFKKLSYVLFGAFMIIGSIESFTLVQIDSTTLWGMDILVNYVSSLKNCTIASDYEPNALSFFTEKNIIPLNEKALSDSWLKNNNISYVILSIYGEFRRNPIDRYYYPKIFGYEIKLIGQKYSVIRPPPDLKFSSETYKLMEREYKKIKEIHNYSNQTVFIIYEI